MTIRYAIYFCPERDTRLWQLASAWLGYDAASGRSVPPSAEVKLAQQDIDSAISKPARYGFHATLMAPFELASHCSERELRAAVADFCARHRAFTTQLHVRRLHNFLALAPVVSDPDLDMLAEYCLRTFDTFRAPLSRHDCARRDTPDLDDRQRAHLVRWGYPYVLDAFRFHMSLTSALPADRLASVHAALRTLFVDVLRAPVAISGLTLVRQSNRDAPFAWVEQFRFSADLSTPRPYRSAHA